MTPTLLRILGVAFILSVPLLQAPAFAASARCAAFCTGWCEKHYAWKNTAACSQQCQLRHCQ